MYTQGSEDHTREDRHLTVHHKRPKGHAAGTARPPTPEGPQKIHTNRANKKAVLNWKYRFDIRVSYLKKEGFTIPDMDKTFFGHDVASGYEYWSPR